MSIKWNNIDYSDSWYNKEKFNSTDVLLMYDNLKIIQKKNEIVEFCLMALVSSSSVRRKSSAQAWLDKLLGTQPYSRIYFKPFWQRKIVYNANPTMVLKPLSQLFLYSFANYIQFYSNLLYQLTFLLWRRI